MSDGTAHDVVAHADGMRLWEECVVFEERRKLFPAPNVEVEVYASEMVEDEVANCVSALDGIRVVEVGGQEPRVVCGEE